MKWKNNQFKMCEKPPKPWRKLLLTSGWDREVTYRSGSDLFSPCKRLEMILGVEAAAAVRWASITWEEWDPDVGSAHFRRRDWNNQLSQFKFELVPRLRKKKNPLYWLKAKTNFEKRDGIKHNGDDWWCWGLYSKAPGSGSFQADVKDIFHSKLLQKNRSSL